MTLLHVIFLMAIVVEAASGALMGMRRRLDLFGIAAIGTVTALGGGSMRDVVLGNYPLGWVANPDYVLLAIGASVGAAVLARRLHRLKSAFLVLDALGLVALTVIGCDIAAAMGVPVAIVVLMGVVTGVFGGMLRDILCNQVPLVFQSDLYATVSLFTGVLYMGMLHFNVSHGIATFIAIALGFAFRLIAIRYSLGLPVFEAETGQ